MAWRICGRSTKPVPGLSVQALLMLAAAGEVHAARDTGLNGTAAHRLNARLAERGGREGWLAAPAIGSAVRVDTVELAIALCLLREPGPSRADAVQGGAGSSPP